MRLPITSRFWLWLFVGALGLAFLFGLNSWGPLESSEARYAEIGREMLTGQDWLHPRLLGIQHFHKPPLTYWLTAAGLGLLGESAIGVRILPVVAVLLQVVLVYGMGLLLFAGDRARALAAAVVYGTLPVVLISALNVTTDAYLATLELAAAYGILRYYYTGRLWGLYLFWIGLGLAFLTKGPVGFVLPLMAVLGFYFHRKNVRPRLPFTWHHALGMVVFVLVGVSWYWYLIVENPTFLRYFLYEHTVERFANSATFHRAKPWWFYLVLAPATSLPWSVVLITQIVRTRWAEMPQQWRNVLVFWVVVPLLFFSLSSSKLLLYVLPVFPGVALLTVYYLGRLTDGVLHRWYVGFGAVYGLLLAVLCVLPLLTIDTQFPLETNPATAVWPAAGVVLIVATLVLWDEVRMAPRLLVLSALFTVVLLLAGKPILRQNELRFNGSRPLAELLQEHQLTKRPVLVYNELLPSLAFATGRIPVSLYDGNDALNRETQFETTPAWQSTLINLRDARQTPYLDSLLAQHPILLVKDHLPTKRHYLLHHFTHHEQRGKWTLYW